ncbi:PREDICTED: ATPase family AAA domain-containing protein 5 isoform X2 [Poecilia mexicana]|uniref:ATPase family AAA domain-containing protein 5 isoform X2 n=1 Tax=Poecilia mexicana TaxID=48701 RepID=UPI00072ED7ED|nr:PREDICTED: ATPase family AAA domain-containing protein 5 isoform X2 [Poecilia mexicana]
MKRNKLKRNKTKQNKDGHHRHVRTAVIVLSDGGCSDGGTSQEKPSAAGSEERESSLCKGFKMAPIFLRTNQHAKIKGRSDGGSYQTEHKSMSPSQSDDVQSQLPHLTGRRGPVSCREQQLPASHLESCLKAIQKSNPAFPVSTVFSTLLKKGSQRLHESEPAEHSLHPDSMQKEKRRRGPEVSQRLPKRLRSDPSAGGHCPLSGQDEKMGPKGHELSPGGLENSCHTNPGWMNLTTPATELIKSSEEARGDSSFEDVLWTDKYVPQHSSEIIGNSVSVNKLHSWLKNWKRRADGDERSQMAERKRDENGSWDCGDFQGEAGLEDRGAEPLGKAMLLSGPSGVGKTAAVYACAQELGFKVFEVNCSSQRSGRHVLSQLKETTQSHLVEIPGEDPLKPAYFNNYSANSCTPKPETLPAKLQFPKNIVSTSKKRAARNSSSRKFRAKPATVTLARYFKAKTGKAKTEAAEYSSAGCDQEVPHNKKTATSLILFEEVDVVFDDDVGFLTAIKAFMTTTKRPVVMTTNDPSFKERFGCNLDEITFKTPPSANVCSYLQLVCLAENFQLPPDDASSLFKLACGDVRRSLLQLQLWVNGSKGLQGGELAEEPVSSRLLFAEGCGLDSKVPPWQAGCSAHMLGLHPVTPNYLLNFLKRGPLSEENMLKFLKILSESWRRGVPFLHSNLELLLSIGAPESDSQQQTEPRRSNPHILPLSHTFGSEVPPTRNKSSRLSRTRFTASASASHLTSRPQRAPSFTETRDKPEKRAAKAVTDCLDGLADFFDLMSSIDATLPHYVSGPHAAEAFVWTGADLKDGLSDEPREEDSRSLKQGRLQDMKAAAEGLGCRQCWWRVTEAWTDAYRCKQKLNDKQWNRLQRRLLLTGCSKSQNLSFSAQPGCASSVSQRRSRGSRLLLSSESFSLLGNRRAVYVDYLPALRLVRHAVGAQQHHLGRCWNYLGRLHLGLSKSAIQLLAEDFTLTKVQKHS